MITMQYSSYTACACNGIDIRPEVKLLSSKGTVCVDIDRRCSAAASLCSRCEPVQLLFGRNRRRSCPTAYNWRCTLTGPGTTTAPTRHKSATPTTRTSKSTLLQLQVLPTPFLACCKGACQRVVRSSSRPQTEHAIRFFFVSHLCFASYRLMFVALAAIRFDF